MSPLALTRIALSAILKVSFLIYPSIFPYFCSITPILPIHDFYHDTYFLNICLLVDFTYHLPLTLCQSSLKTYLCLFDIFSQISEEKQPQTEIRRWLKWEQNRFFPIQKKKKTLCKDLNLSNYYKMQKMLAEHLLFCSFFMVNFRWDLAFPQSCGVSLQETFPHRAACIVKAARGRCCTNLELVHGPARDSTHLQSTSSLPGRRPCSIPSELVTPERSLPAACFPV